MNALISIEGGESDYTPGPYIVSFPTGLTMTPFKVPIVNDNILEDDETFTLAIDTGSLPSRVSRGNLGQATVTIVNVIGKCLCVINGHHCLSVSAILLASTITFNQSTYSVNESDGKIDITLHHNNPSSIDIMLMVNSNNVTTSGEW